MSQSTVRLGFNSRQLVKHLRNSFTDSTTVLSELAQNARRAGASYVAFEFNESKKQLRIADNGKGIQDLQSLFSKADSQWDQKVMEEDEPYGMGFLSALYAATRITIESNGQALSFDTAAALAFEELKVTESHRYTGAMILLEEVQLTYQDVEERLKNIAMGFPIDIKFNGESLPRPHAVDNLDFQDTAIGKVHLFGQGDILSFYSAIGSDNYVAYLQGMKIASKNGHYDNLNIIHLDSLQFKGRAPDRAVLVNEDHATNLITDTIKKLWCLRLTKLAMTTQPEIIAKDWYESLKKWGALKLLNDIPYLSPRALGYTDQYPSALEYAELYSGLGNKTKLITRQQVESGECRVVKQIFQSDPSETFHHAMYLYHHGALMLVDQLDNDHWIWPYIIDVDDSNVAVTLVGPVVDTYYYGNRFSSPVALCDHVVLDGPLGAVTIRDEAFQYIGGFISLRGYPLPIATDELSKKEHWYDNGLLVVPVATDHGSVVKQCSMFMDENDSSSEDDMIEEMDLFYKFILSHRAGNEIKLVKDLLYKANYDSYSCLKEKTFTISFKLDKDGRENLHVEMR